MKNKMMREYVSGTNTLVSLDSPELFPKDATCLTRNAEKWNDFHEDSATRDSGRREYSHKELGDRKHDKLVEERHLEGPSGKADQWRQSEYFESNKVGARARVLRKEHALNEQNEHVSRDDGTTRKTSTHSSTVHVSTRMTTNTALGEGGMDLLSLEDHSPLDHSPQKGKGSLGKQGALNQRRRPTKGSWRLNTSPERELNGDTYINDVTNSTTNLRSLSSDVEKQNAENYWRSKTSVNNDTSKYQTYSKKIVNDVTTVDSKNRNWIRHKRDTNKAEDLRSSGTPIVGSAFCGTRTPPSEPTTRSSRVTDRKQNNNVIVLDTGTWTKKDKTSPERLVRESTTNKVTRDSQWTKNTYNRDFKQSSPMSTTTPEQFPRKFTLHEDKDYKTTKGTAFTSDRRMHSEVSSSDHSNFNSADKYKKSYGVDKSKPVSQGVTIVEGPTTKVVSSFTHNDTTWKKTLDTTSQRYGTYNKKERTSSERSPPTEVTINGTHPPTHSPTSSSKNRSSGSPGPTQRSPRPRTNEPNRKLGTEPATKSEDRRTVIMNEIRSFDPKKLRKQQIEHFTLPAVNLNPTHLWVAKDDTTDSYGYSQSELVFMDEDQDSDRWSPRPFSPNVLRGRSPRAISPSIERNWSDQNVEPSWVQIANEKQVRSLNWELMDQQDTGNASGNPWKDVSLREIKKYVPDSQLESQESVSSWEWVDTNELMSKSHEDEQPEWVELAQQRQHKYEQHEIDESLRRSTPSPIIPTWKTQIRLRATPGVPTKDDVEIKTDYAIMREKLRSPTFVERQSTVVKPEWLQNVKLKKTSHLTEVKGPKVGRVVSPQFTERPKSPVVDQTYIHHIVRPRSPERSASPPPMTTTFTTTRRAADDISVDRVLSSIRLIREASASYPNLRETAYSTGHEFSTSPAWRIEKKLSPTTKYETFPRPTSPSYARRSPDVIDVSTAESFATPPQWLTDLKSRVKHKRLQELSSPTEETSFKFDKRLTSPTSTYNKRRSWSPRTNFTNVLEEIRSVNPSEILTDVHTSRRYGSLRRNTERPQQRARAESPTYNRSSSPRERPPSPTEKFTEEKHQPATWWVQVPSQIDASDSESRLRKFEAFLQKRVTSPPSRSYSKPFYTGRVFGKSPSSSPPGRRTPSPPSRRSPSPHERSESPTCSRYLAHLDRAQSSSDTNLASISTSPQRPITTTTTTTQSPTKTTKIVVTPKTSSPSRVVTKKTTPKARQHPAKTITTKATRSSPSSTGDQKLKSSPGKQRTTLTISAVQSRVQQESKAAREKSNVSPQKFPTSPSKTTITSKKTENKERPSRQMTVNRSTTPLSSTRTSPKTTSSDASIAKGRFSQLLTELSSPPSTLTRSESLKSKTSSRQAEKASTFPKRSTQSTTTAKSGSFTSASLVRQVNTASSGTYNIRKPRVRFSATEIVWPLDQDGHSPAVTTCHHPIRVTE